MTRRNVKAWGFAAAFVVQAALLAWMVADRAMLLARGTEIRLPVLPVDPRDLFRGDYVTLSYRFSTLVPDKLAGEEDFAEGEPIYVSLRREKEEWMPVAAHRAPPTGEVVLKGRVIDANASTADCQAPCRAYRVDYGLEQFFVPEGAGRELEKLRNDQRLEVDVAVAANGRAALKRLLVDGQVRYEDTLF